MDGYKKLVVWQKADRLAREVYLSTRSFPKSELFGLTSQLQRAALSIPVNIAEGTGRQNRNETRHFANVALGSLAETKYLVDFCGDLGYISPEKQECLRGYLKDVGALLWGFYKSF